MIAFDKNIRLSDYEREIIKNTDDSLLGINTGLKDESGLSVRLFDIIAFDWEQGLKGHEYQVHAGMVFFEKGKIQVTRMSGLNYQWRLENSKFKIIQRNGVFIPDVKDDFKWNDVNIGQWASVN